MELLRTLVLLGSLGMGIWASIEPKFANISLSIVGGLLYLSIRNLARPKPQSSDPAGIEDADD